MVLQRICSWGGKQVPQWARETALCDLGVRSALYALHLLGTAQRPQPEYGGARTCSCICPLAQAMFLFVIPSTCNTSSSQGVSSMGSRHCLVMWNQ